VIPVTKVRGRVWSPGCVDASRFAAAIVEGHLDDFVFGSVLFAREIGTARGSVLSTACVVGKLVLVVGVILKVTTDPTNIISRFILRFAAATSGREAEKKGTCNK
jgi:hypothetical protein